MLGVTVPNVSNWGSTVKLFGNRPEEKVKLLRLTGPGDSPWLASVSAKFPPDAAPGGVTGVRVTGRFGSGGGSMPVDFDAKPGTMIQLPGQSIDLDVGWAPEYTGSAASTGGAIEVFITPSVASRVEGAAVACHGEAARGAATSTLSVQLLVAGNWILPIPPFADAFTFYNLADAAYANVTSLEFGTSPIVGGFAPIVTFTGAQLLALKNAGIAAPVPGIAAAMRITTGAAVLNSRVSFELSL